MAVLLPTEEDVFAQQHEKMPIKSRNVGPRKDGANLWFDPDVEYDYENGPLEAEEVAAVVADAVGELVDGGSPCCDGGSTTDASEEDASFLDDLFIGIDLETEFGSSDAAASAAVLGIGEGGYKETEHGGGGTDGEDGSGLDEVCCSVVRSSCEEENGLKYAAVFLEEAAGEAEEQDAAFDKLRKQQNEGGHPDPSLTAALFDIPAPDLDNNNTNAAVSSPSIAAAIVTTTIAHAKEHDRSLRTGGAPFTERAVEFSCASPTTTAAVSAKVLTAVRAECQTSPDAAAAFLAIADSGAGRDYDDDDDDDDADAAANVMTPDDDDDAVQGGMLSSSRSDDNGCGGGRLVVDVHCDPHAGAPADATTGGVAVADDDDTTTAIFKAPQDGIDLGSAQVVSLGGGGGDGGGGGVSDADIDIDADKDHDHAVVGTSADIIAPAAMAAGVSAHLLNAVDLWESANAKAKSSRRARRAARRGSGGNGGNSGSGDHTITAGSTDNNKKKSSIGKKKKNEFGKRRRSSGGGDGAAGVAAALLSQAAGARKGKGKVKADPLVALKDKRLLSRKPLIVQWLRSDGCEADAEAETAVGKAVESLDSIHTHYWGGGG